MLEALHLQHFKGYEDYNVMFPPGLTLITGANYSGKTRLLHAILFAFWGVSAVPGGAKLVPSRGRKPAETQVQARFFHQGHTYVVERKVATAKLWEDNELIATGTTAVNREMESRLNTPQKFFMRLKYAEQSETQALLTLGAGELHKVIEHVSGANLVNRVIERSSKAASAAQAGLDALGSLGNLDDLRAQEQALADDLRARYADLEEHKNIEAQLLAEVSEKESHLQLYETSNREHQRMKQERSHLETRLAEAQENMRLAQEEISQHGELAAKAPQLRLDLDSEVGRRRRAEDWASDIESLQVSIASAAQQEKALLGELEKQRAALGELGANRVTETLQARLEAQARYEELNRQREEVDQAINSAVCPMCHRPFEGQNSETLVERQHEIEMARREAGEVLRKAQDEHAMQEEVARRINAIKTDIAATERSLDLNEQRALMLVSEQEEAQGMLNNEMAHGPLLEPDEILARQEQVTQAEQASGVVWSAKGRLKTSKAHAEEYQKKLNMMPEPPAFVDTTDLSKALSRVKEAAREANRHVLSKTTSYGARHSEWSALLSKVNAEEQRQEHVRELQKQKETATDLTKYLRANRDRFLQELWGQVMAYASNVAIACTGGAIERVERTTDGAFQFIEAGDVAAIEGASGAQKSIMSIGVQLALDLLLPDTFGALLLDEPTSQMDAERSLALTQTLAETGRQIIMVSHREMDATVAQGHIHLG